MFIPKWTQATWSPQALFSITNNNTPEYWYEVWSMEVQKIPVQPLGGEKMQYVPPLSKF